MLLSHLAFFLCFLFLFCVFFFGEYVLSIACFYIFFVHHVLFLITRSPQTLTTCQATNLPFCILPHSCNAIQWSVFLKLFVFLVFHVFYKKQWNNHTPFSCPLTGVGVNQTPPCVLSLVYNNTAIPSHHHLLPVVYHSFIHSTSN
jgi:hypothetical protein